ncbi:MAG: hypothetical protein WC495_00400 [Patescibacteria group bacterium]|jgi:protein-tyrosine-phosphatase
MKKVILFICNGNIHRSVVAERSLKKILLDKGLKRKFIVASYGLQGTKGTTRPLHNKLIQYPKEYKAAQPTLAKLGINIGSHSYQKITSKAIRRASVIIAMDKMVYSKNKNSLLQQFPMTKNKIHLFSELTIRHRNIPDPSGTGDKKLHEHIIKNIYFTVRKKVDTILRWAS